MRKMKKIITLAMTLVMMMAMSITAFAAPKSDASFTVTNLANDEATTLKIYELAKAGTNKWDFATWIPTTAITEKKENGVVTGYDFDWAAIKTAAEGQNPSKPAYETQATNGVYETSHTFTGLTGAAYLVLASGTDYIYNPMGQVTYEYDSNGVYIYKDATVKAKSSNVPVRKTADKQFVHVGDEVTFDIKTAVPNEATTFVLTDSPVNLNDLELTKITLAGDELTVSDFNLVGPTEGLYTVDLTALLANKDNVGATVIVTIKATVGSDIVISEGQTEGYAFKNSAWSNLGTPKDRPDVVGYTGDITLTKYDDNEHVLAGAKFKAYKVIDNENVYLKFDANNKFAGFAESVEDATEIAATDGTVKVLGLSAGEYGFHETVAPTGYSLNQTDATTTLEASTTANTHAFASMPDTKLISLPFTGGMGTTIFTILGVAIMAMAAALFFATKKSR